VASSLSTASAVVGAFASIVGGALPLQSLAVLSAMPCASPEGMQSAGPMRYLLSPLYDLGWGAVAAGNIGVSLAVPLLHCGVGAMMRAVRVAPSLPDALVLAQFPSWSFALACLLFQGACQSAFTLLATGGGVEVLLGAAGAAYVVAFLTVAQFVALRHTAALRFFPYDFGRRHGAAAAWVLPVGRWGPPLLRVREVRVVRSRWAQGRRRRAAAAGGAGEPAECVRRGRRAWRCVGC
jgi:hypothetical protein